MDVLVVLGTTSAWLYGVILLFIGHKMEMHADSEMSQMQIQMHGHNFEISSTLITVILLGKLLEATSKKQTVEKLAQLASLKATRALVVPSADLTVEGEYIDIELV